MSSSKSSRRNRRSRKQRSISELADAVANPPEPVEAPDPPLPDTVPAENGAEPVFPPTERKRSELSPADVLVVLECGDRREYVYGNSSIADAAETAASQFIAELTAAGRWPTTELMVTCYNQTSQFGPFPVNVTLTVDALFLRGEQNHE